MSAEYQDLSKSPDIADRMAFRLWKRQTGTMEQGAGELRLVIDMQRDLGATALATSVKDMLSREGYIVRDDVDALLETQLEGHLMEASQLSLEE